MSENFPTQDTNPTSVLQLEPIDKQDGTSQKPPTPFLYNATVIVHMPPATVDRSAQHD
jgi:hypothetical protein